MVTEAYVSFEIAKLLKEKGFDGEFNTHMFYSEFDSNIHPITEIGLVKDEDVYFAPTHQMALAWLREKFNIHITTHTSTASRYYPILMPIPYDKTSILLDMEIGWYDSYEEAVEAGLLYVLKELL